MKPGVKIEVSSSKSADNRDERKLPPSAPPAIDRAFEPEFIDVTEDDYAIIISGVLHDKNAKSGRDENQKSHGGTL